MKEVWTNYQALLLLLSLMVLLLPSTVNSMVVLYNRQNSHNDAVRIRPPLPPTSTLPPAQLLVRRIKSQSKSNNNVRLVEEVLEGLFSVLENEVALVDDSQKKRDHLEEEDNDRQDRQPSSSDTTVVPAKVTTTTNAAASGSHNPVRPTACVSDCRDDHQESQVTIDQSSSSLLLPSVLSSYSSVVVEALSVLGKSQQDDLILKWYHRWMQLITNTIRPEDSNEESLPSSASSSRPTIVMVDESVRTAAISALGYCGCHLKAIQLLPSNETITADTGTHNDLRPQHNVLVGGWTTACYDAAIAACKKPKDWNTALHIFHQHMSQASLRPSSSTINVLMSVLLESRQGLVALELLHEYLDHNNSHDNIHSNDDDVDQCQNSNKRQKSLVSGVTFQLVTNALIRSNEIDKAYQLLCRLSNLSDSDLKEFYKVGSMEPMYDLVISAYGRKSNWEAVERVENLRRRRRRQRKSQPHYDHKSQEKMTRMTSTTTTTMSRPGFQAKHWKGLPKIKTGTEVYWVVGTYHPLNMTVGLRPNRNPTRNGIQIVFYLNEKLHSYARSSDDVQLNPDNPGYRKKKIGYLLMKNTVSDNPINKSSDNKEDGRSSLLGMFLDPDQRGKGLAKSCLAIWLWFCLRGNIQPSTGILRKPLLSLTLQHTFGFVPVGQKGVDVELCYDLSRPNMTILYRTSGKSLEGAFSPWDLEKQGIRLVSTPPTVRGRIVRVGCELFPPRDKGTLEESVDKYIKCRHEKTEMSMGDENWECYLTTDQIRNLFLFV